MKSKVIREWKEGTVQDFLELSDVDMALVETKVTLTRMFRRKCEAGLRREVPVKK